MSPADRLLESVHSSWMAQAIYVAAELRLAEQLGSGPKTSDELAVATEVDAPSLHRLLRALCTIDICHELPSGKFQITETGKLLAGDAPGSLRHWVIWWSHYLWPVWGNLLYSVKTGESARTLLTGKDGFGHLERDPESADIFNRAMAELTTLISTSVVSAYDFKNFKRVIDIGGGHGQLLSAILRTNPSAIGVLFDLPHAIDGAKKHLQEAGVIDRCEVTSGDFFQSVPTGGDAYILKSVIHDWDDEKAGKILENCRKAMTPQARLLLVERVVPKMLENSAEHQSLMRTDLSMLVALAARERGEDEFAQLLAKAKFKIQRIVPAHMTVSVIEAIPV